MWYSGPWPVFPAFLGVREVIIFRLKIYGKEKYFQKKIMGRKKIPPGRRDQLKQRSKEGFIGALPWYSDVASLTP